MADENKKCGYTQCRCVVSGNDKYCSDYCKDAQSERKSKSSATASTLLALSTDGVLPNSRFHPGKHKPVLAREPVCPGRLEITGSSRNDNSA